MTTKDVAIHPMMKLYMGFDPETSDDEIREYWSEEFPTEIEKPCGILQWCPYGPLVEDFPLDGTMHDDASFKRMEIVPASACMVFGHDCPVFYVAEPMSDLDAIADNCLCEECRQRRDAGELDCGGAPSDTDTPNQPGQRNA